MPGERGHRNFSQKQKIALLHRQERMLLQYRPMQTPGEDPLPAEFNLAYEKKTREEILEEYLVTYGARLLELAQRYPLGDSQRPEWFEVHRRCGLERLKRLLGGKPRGR